MNPQCNREHQASIDYPDAMSVPWFHVEALPGSGEIVLLDKKEAKHALGPRRLGDGDEVVVFDGQGSWASARIGSRDERGGLELVVGDHHQAVSENPSIELAASLPKGDRLSTMLDMATQLGIAAFTPLKCTFSVVSLDRKRQDPTERWNRIMVEACKQSRRATLPAIGPESTPAAVIDRAAAEGATVIVGDAAGESPVEVAASAGRVVVLVGPEGGFSPPEQQMLLDAESAGSIRRVAIGRGVLRVETAAAALVALVRAAGSAGRSERSGP